MRRLFLLAVLCGVCSLAIGAPWDVLDPSAQVDHKPTESLSALISRTLLPQLLARREPLRYCIEGVPSTREYASLLERGYTEWAAATARMIRKENRAKEFADLLPVLDEPFLFEQQNCSNNPLISMAFHPEIEESYWETDFVRTPEQVRLIILPQDEVNNICAPDQHGEAVACAAGTSSGLVVLMMADRKEAEPENWWLSLLHEIGHTIGMGEGYQAGATANSPLFGTSSRPISLMKALKESTRFSCDDADAMIIFSDTVALPGKPARTGKTARMFQSLCKDDPIWYVDGRQQNRPLRAVGDNSGFSQTTYRADGKPSRFSMYEPLAKGFPAAFRLSDDGLDKAPSRRAGGMTYYTADDGRTFVVEDLEEISSKRIFTLRSKRLLGETILGFSSPTSIRASTSLSLGEEMRLLREESIYRQENEEYGTYFVYEVYEGSVKKGILANSSAQVLYVFRDWLVMALIEPGASKVTTVLLEKNAGGSGQRMQMFQGAGDKDLASGSFVLTLTDIKAVGDISERDKKYLQTFVDSVSKNMRKSLLNAAQVGASEVSAPATESKISAKQVSAWANHALGLFSKLGRGLKYQFDGGQLASDSRPKAYPVFEKLFVPAPVSRVKPILR